jgi:4-amino-4-deoxy-L-arabinose transferase-like glycosyltransferase
MSAPLISLAIFLLALAPRALWQGRFVTIDEAYHWFDRARLFLHAVRTGDWAATNLVGHPGVTTMWLGALGIATHQALAALGLAAWPDSELLRLMLRLPVAVVTSLCVVLGYALLRRLLPMRAALLAALLWAGDPFLVAHSQLLHVDALLTSFITLSLLAALLAFRLEGDADGEPVRWRFLLASAVAGGLALLTKSPAIMWPPMVGLIAVVAAWRRIEDRGSRIEDGRWRIASRRSSILHLPSSVILPLLVWAVVAALVWMALWPAAWADLPGAIGSVVHQAEADGGSPHGWGNFFLGRAVADPGPLFYPVAVVLRLTPWALLGLALTCFRFLIFDFRLSSTIQNPKSKIQNQEGRHVLLVLLAFVLLFVLMMSVPAKKFDRYALPIFPALDILAASGLLWLWDGLRRIKTKNKEQRTDRRVGSLLCSLFFVLVGVNLAWYHPYELAYYNPLLGGGPAAARLIPVGWGEGLELAGAYITAQPDGAEQTVATWYRPALKPYIPGTLVPLGDLLIPNKVGYAVLYIDQVQRRDDAAATDWLRAHLKPVHTVRIHGIDYAEIYRVPAQPAHAIEADFGPAIHFRGYDLDASTAARGFVRLTVHWQAQDRVAGDMMLFVHVLDARGQRVGGIDVPPGGAGAPTSQWQAGGYVSAVLQVPLQHVPEDGWIAIGLYDPHDGARLELRAPPQPGAPADGPNALLLGPLKLKSTTQG